jgi:hypothetical protein
MSLDVLVIAALIAVQTITVTLSGYVITRSFHRETQTLLSGMLDKMEQRAEQGRREFREMLERLEKYRLVERK